MRQEVAINKIIERQREPRRPTYQELETALRDALARVEMLEEYARRQLLIAAEVTNPWKN